MDTAVGTPTGSYANGAGDARNLLSIKDKLHIAGRLPGCGVDACSLRSQYLAGSTLATLRRGSETIETHAARLRVDGALRPNQGSADRAM